MRVVVIVLGLVAAGAAAAVTATTQNAIQGLFAAAGRRATRRRGRATDGPVGVPIVYAEDTGLLIVGDHVENVVGYFGRDEE